MSRFFTFFVRFLGKIWAWRTARGGSDGKNAVFKTLLHGSFIDAYICKDFGRDFFGRATPAFKCEKRPPRGVVFCDFFGNLSLLAKTKALLVEIIPFSVETIALSVCPTSLLIFPMSLLVARNRAIGKNEGEWGRKKRRSGARFSPNGAFRPHGVAISPFFVLSRFCTLWKKSL